MNAIRVMPCLLLKGAGLVKTVKFKDPKYLGDPRNAVRIFNEKEVDELVVLDITATPQGKGPNFDLVQEIVSEAFMPVGYGGGVSSMDHIHRLLYLGIEKVIITSAAIDNPALVREASETFGSQSVVVCLDVKKKMWGGYELYSHSGGRGRKLDPVEFARRMEDAGAGELIVNSIDCDGVMQGYDTRLIRSVSSAVNIPVVASGGAGKLEDLAAAIAEGGASAVAAGSLFVFQGKHRAVLINYPEYRTLVELFRGISPQGA